MAPSTRVFQKTIYTHYKKAGRHNLPWRKAISPYKILVSEIMLQQTQVDRVVPKFNNFLKKFPTVKKLADASLVEVLGQWSGLGYNRRGRFLQEAAKAIIRDYKGKIPSDPILLELLPGVGKYTARAVAVQAFDKPYAMIETNIRRVYIHHFFTDSTTVTDAELMPIIEKTFDTKNPRQWVWALMDYGSHLPKIVKNPNRKSKHYIKQSKFTGSIREVRGAILKTLIQNKTGITLAKVKSAIKADDRFDGALTGLLKDQMVILKNEKLQIKK